MTDKNLIPLDDIEAVNNRALAVFKDPLGLEPLLVAIESECRAQPVVLNTENGRKNIKALARKVGSAKNRVDEIGKALNDVHRKEINIVDATRRTSWKRLEDLQAEILKPVEEWEAADKNRIAAHEEKLKWIESLVIWGPEMPHPVTSAMVQARIALVEADAREWEEYANRAIRIKGEVLAGLKAHHAEAVAAEIAAEESARWLALYAEAAQENREFDLQVAAAKAAREFAEAQAAIDLVYEQALTDNALFDQKAAEARTLKEEQAKWDAIYAAADAQNDSFDTNARAAEFAKREAAKAVLAEQNKVAAAAKQKELDEEKRKADEAHKKKIHNEVFAAICEEMPPMLPESCQIYEDLIFKIAEGKIPHVRITY